MKKIFISFCRGGDNIIEQVIKTNLKSDFIHVEIITVEQDMENGLRNDRVYDFAENNGKDGKKKWFLEDRLKETKSYVDNINEIFELKIPEEKFYEVYKFIENYYKNYNYDKAMKIYKIGDLGLGNKEFIKGSPDRTTTICSHFCFKVIRFIVRNYYKDYDLLNYRVEEIENHYREKLEYITPGHLYNVFREHTELFG